MLVSCFLPLSGYGFVDFETHQAAATALTALKDQAVDVHFARLSVEKVC